MRAPGVPRVPASKSPTPLRERLSCSVEEALEASNIGRTKFYQLVDAGAIRTRKVGRRRLVLVDSLLAFLNETDAA